MNNFNELTGFAKEMTETIDKLSQMSAFKHGKQVKVKGVGPDVLSAINDLSNPEFRALISNNINNLTEEYDKNLDQILSDMKTLKENPEEQEGVDELKQKIIQLYKTFVTYETGVNSLIKQEESDEIMKLTEKSIRHEEEKLRNIGSEFIKKIYGSRLVDSFFYDIPLKPLFSSIESGKENGLFELIKFQIKNGAGITRADIARGITKFNITDPDKLFEIAMLCIEAKCGSSVLQNIKSFKITDQAQLLKIAMQCIKHGDSKGVTSNIDKFGFEDSEVVVQLLKLTMKKGGAPVLPIIFKNRSLEFLNQEQLYDLTILCIENGASKDVARWLTTFGIEDPEKLLKVLKICVEKGGAAEIVQNIGKFNIKDSEVLLEIAKRSIENGAAAEVVKNMDKFEIKDTITLFNLLATYAKKGGAKEIASNTRILDSLDQNQRFEILKLCIQNEGADDIAALHVIGYLGIDDPEKRFELLKLYSVFGGDSQVFSTLKDPDEYSEYIENLGLETEEKRFEFLKHAVIFGQGEKVAEIVKSYYDNKDSISVEDQENLFEFAMLCARNGGASGVLSDFSFKIKDPDKLFEVWKVCAENGEADEVVSIAERAAMFEDKIKDEAKFTEMWKVCAENGAAESIVKKLKNTDEYSFIKRKGLLQIYGFCMQYAKNASTIQKIHNSLFFKVNFDFSVQAAVSEKFYDSFDFSRVKDRMIIRQKESFGSTPFNDVLNEVMEIKDNAIKYKSLILLADMMLVFHPLGKDIDQMAWGVTKMILPAIFKFGKPGLKLPLVSCASMLASDKEAVKSFNDLKVDESKYWKKLTGSLYTLLINQGIDSKILTEKGAFRAETEKKDSIFDKKENTQALVEMLLLLVQNKTLSSIEKQEILERIISESADKNKEILNNIYSVTALINFQAFTELKDKSKKLATSAEDVFSSKCQMNKVEDFATKYALRLSESRNPGAIITYAGIINSLNDKNASECLGKYVTALLNGTFEEDRYDFKNNFHLQAVEKSNPGIVAKWKTSVCENEKLNGLTTMNKIEVKKQSEKEWMFMKLETDKHLDLDKLEFLKNYLLGVDESVDLDKVATGEIKAHQNKIESKMLKLALEIKEIREKIQTIEIKTETVQKKDKNQKKEVTKEDYEKKLIAKVKNLKKEIGNAKIEALIDLNDDDLIKKLEELLIPSLENLTRLQLQQQCIRFLKYSEEMDALIKNKEPSEKIKAVKSQIKFSLETIEKMLEATTLLPGSGDFLNDIRSKQQEIKGEKVSKEGVIIVDTDDPIDLLLSGTDISGSCQRIDGESIRNKGLLGYLMDGKNRMIAIKASKGQAGKIQARCLIRLLLDGEKPVLFMERIYCDVQDSKYPEALLTIAKRKAAELGIPLVSLEGQGVDFGNPLKSLGGPSPWEYSDGTRTGFPHANGIFTIHGARHVI